MPNAPGSALRAHRGGEGADALRNDELVRELSLDLAQMAIDLAGVVDPTPVSDGVGALFALARGQWLDAALSGVSMIPYVGDLAKAGKLPRYLRSVERACELARRVPDFADLLRPAMMRLQGVLELFPPGGGGALQMIRRRVADFVGEFGQAGLRQPQRLPDIRAHHRHYTSVGPNGRRIAVSEGRLGVPGKVQTHRSATAQRRVAGGTGDDAGHRMGNQFGSSGTEENLDRQTWFYNREAPGQSLSGTPWKRLEDEWEQKLQEGVGIEVKVVDEFLEDGRPFARRVWWTEVDTRGGRVSRYREFINPRSEETLRRAGVSPPSKPGSKLKILPI
jgi:hypothetical protein